MTYRELRTILLSKGEAEEDRKGEHAFFWIDVGGRSYRATKVSHGATGQISSQLLSQISRQMRLTNKELREFVRCKLEKDQWLNLWQERGHNWR